jgi:hypothetical protein
MAVQIDGRAQKRAVLTPNTENIITFSPSLQKLAIMADGGIVYFKVNKTITDNNDLTANYIKDGGIFDLYKGYAVFELHCYTTTSNVTLQWFMP